MRIAQRDCLVISAVLPADAASELDVFHHDGDALGVNCTVIGIFEKTHKVGLGCMLEGQHCRCLEAQIGLEILQEYNQWK